jgi:hypothetical protein
MNPFDLHQAIPRSAMIRELKYNGLNGAGKYCMLWIHLSREDNVRVFQV